MKKKFIIYSLFLSGSFFFSLAIQAQQQKKPSERSFAAEINKVKQIQAARNTTIRQTQQPVDNIAVVDGNNKQTAGTEQNQKTMMNPVSKPSTGNMRQKSKPVVSKE